VKYLIIFIFLSFINLVSSQVEKKSVRDSLKILQLSGVVVSENGLDQLPYTTVFDLTTRHGVITDYYGYFSLVTYPGDTLMFSYYGYKTSSFVVPDTLKDNRYSIIHMLQEDTINLPEVTVYPWPSRENFAKEFVEMEPYSDAFRRAKKQLSGENLSFAAARLEGDASLSFGSVQNQQYTKIYTNGQMPANNFLNPYAWAKFIDEWKKGNLKKK
jgi:hypothetical protein